jgi:uncharacterized protein (UPF0276 family)
LPGAIPLGLGLRPPFYAEAAQGRVAVDWFELITENFMVAGGNPLRVLDAVAERYPVALHGVSLNLGGSDALDADYLDRLDQLARRVKPMHISDHLCWTRHGGHHLHDLLPLPYTEEAVLHVAQRIRSVQDRLGQRILVENVSSYAEFAHGTLCEWAFLAAVSETADCHILLDLNNILVSAHNHGFDAHRYLEAIPAARVRQIHLAGHSMSGPLRIDTHDHPVSDPVWDLYAAALRRFGQVPTMIERDDRIPPLDDLLAELAQAHRIGTQVFAP